MRAWWLFRRAARLVTAGSDVACVLAAACGIAARLVAIGALLAVAPHAARAGDVVSLNLCTDQLLVTLAPERVAALSPLARDASLSVVADRAAALPWVRPEAEAVLALHPARVLAGAYGATDTVALLRARGIAVTRLAEPENLAGIDAQITQAAAVLGVPARGQALLAGFHARLAATQAARPRAADRLTAVLWEARGYSAGPGGFADSVLRAAGLTNAGTGGVMEIEALAARKPDLLVTQSAPATPSLATDMLWHPALRDLRRVALAPAWLACAGPWSMAAVELLERTARGEGTQPTPRGDTGVAGAMPLPLPDRARQ